jgi:hypothetical protein
MPDQLLYVLRPSYQGARLISLGDFNDVASPPASLDGPYSAMISTVRHALVYAGVDPNLDLVSGIVYSEEATETDFSSFSRLLSEKGPSL